MTITLTVLMLLGLVCLFLAALNVTLHPRLSLGWLGLFLFGLVFCVMRGLIG